MGNIKAKDNKQYYVIGQLKDKPHTLVVSLVGGNGGAMMFCQTHSIAYPIKGKCVECQNAVLETDPTQRPETELEAATS